MPTTAARRVRALAAAALLAVALAVLAAPTPSPAPARAGQVVMVDVADFAFAPATLTIQVGDTVQWNNSDPVDHTATSSPGAPEAFDVYLAAGAWGSFTFDTPGSYAYYCKPHPTMTGTIVVEAAPAASAAPSTAGGGTLPDVAVARPADRLPATLGWLAAAGAIALAAIHVRRRRAA